MAWTRPGGTGSQRNVPSARVTQGSAPFGRADTPGLGEDGADEARGKSGMGPGMTPSSPMGMSGAGPASVTSKRSSRKSFIAEVSSMGMPSVSTPTTSMVAPATG